MTEKWGEFPSPGECLVRGQPNYLSRKGIGERVIIGKGIKLYRSRFFLQEIDKSWPL